MKGYLKLKPQLCKFPRTEYKTHPDLQIEALDSKIKHLEQKIAIQTNEIGGLTKALSYQNEELTKKDKALGEFAFELEQKDKKLSVLERKFKEATNRLARYEIDHFQTEYYANLAELFKNELEYLKEEIKNKNIEISYLCAELQYQEQSIYFMIHGAHPIHQGYESEYDFTTTEQQLQYPKLTGARNEEDYSLYHLAPF